MAGSLLAASQAAPLATAWAREPPCRVEPFQGATSAQGATTRMQVVNTGAACSVANYGLPAQRVNPASSGAITAPPAHGTATFAAPLVRYTPAPGYVGDDAFAYEAYAKGAAGQQLRLKVRVEVRVAAP